ncbi:phosphoglycerate mutase family protein [Saccharata proteae CBS 121410]|uniref:Phosphoglycerate mutase family protein n=1 Tax=Saccharata proteae CBS 121410 TaxID=1314787 RepID=A0A9P4HVT2_9PEZI|nr:phosphoglycerate mutase family protein [Saccharata proteae CBS 121410]
MSEATPHHSNSSSSSSSSSFLNYTTVTGFFLQDEASTDASTFDYTTVNLGLINRTYPTDATYDVHGTKTQWQRFAHYVHTLNAEARPHVQYKVLIMGRHGEGYHNVAESFYGTPAWNCYWSELDGNGTVTWADAHLTDAGQQQALVANAFWQKALSAAKIPPPQSYYTSPLARCLATANLTFGGLELPEDRPFKPVVKELLREAIGVHTCDRRSSKTWIHDSYPDFPIEHGFAEDDPLWKADLRETTSAQVLRMTALLTDIFTHDSNTFISLTSHSGSIGAILTAIGHRTFSLVTGAVIPVLVKAERLPGPRSPATSIAASTGPPTCTADPSSAVDGGSMVASATAATTTTV